MLRKWSVSWRLEMTGHKPPKGVFVLATKMFSKCGNNIGFYTFTDYGTLVFVGCRSKQFPNSWGWFPKIFPYNDPYQDIPKGLTSEEFAEILETLGFKPFEEGTK